VHSNLSCCKGVRLHRQWLRCDTSQLCLNGCDRLTRWLLTMAMLDISSILI
jgi:hypothetical protein